MERKCPNCSKTYNTVLNPKHPDKLVQHEFPNATPIQREQLVTGLCSDECWDEYLGPEYME